MNMHVPQSYQTAIEIEVKAAVPKHIMSPSNMSPIIKPSQDNLLGLYKITGDGVEFAHPEVMNMLLGVEKFSGKLPKPDIKNGSYVRWTGKQLFSVILPPISLRKNYDEPDMENVIIENGILKQGQVNKGVSGTIVHMIHNDYGYKEAERYLNDLQKIITRYMIRSGYSVGISDLIIHKDIKKRYQQKIITAKEKAIDLTRKMHLNILEDVNEGLNEIYEAKVRKVTADTTNEISKIGRAILDKENRIKRMIQSGSKGKALNIQQMIYLLGEQSIDGKRVPLGFGDRSLPHYPKYENGVESRGFIANNFIDGLTPQELFFHAMAGREGLIDTAVKTATSGYLQRKLIKATEDLKANFDFTVRSSNNDVVEFIYGSDGFYPTFLETQKSNFAKITAEMLKNDYIISENEKDENFEGYMLKREVSKMLKDPKYIETIRKYNQTVKDCIDMLFTKYSIHYQTMSDIKLYYPINIKKKLDGVKKTFNLNTSNKSDINVLYIIDKIWEVVEFCKVNGHVNNTLIILLHDFLSPKKLLRDIRITKVAFDYLINLMLSKFDDVLVEGGEMVGPLASQSIGEKSTQLTLNSVEYNTELLLEVDGIMKRVKIGEWIDSRIKLADEDNIEKHPNDTTLEYVKDCKVRVMALKKNGKLIWDDVTAVTKHPVVNKDGTDTLIKVKTESGREVIATKGKSFLKKVNNKFKQINGDKLKVGDYLPVSTISLKPEKTINEWDLSQYISKSEFIYMSEVKKAVAEHKRIVTNGGGRHWFQNNKNFTLPYKRSDIFMDAYKNQFKKGAVNKRSNTALEYKDNCIYSRIRTGKQPGHIPEKFKLDETFGFFVGAYLAEGHSTKYHVLISNNDDDYLDKIKKFTTQYSIKYHIDDQMKNGGRSRTLRMHSYILAQLCIETLGKTSDLKKLPAEFFNANDDFLKAVIDGYMSGDGCVTKTGVVNAASVSRRLLEDIQTILLRFNIHTRTVAYEKAQEYNIKRGLNAKLSYTMTLTRAESCKFKKVFSLSVKEKQKRLNDMKEPELIYSKTNIVPNIKTSQFGKITIERNQVEKYIRKSKNNKDKNIFIAITKEDVYHDKIISIVDVKNPNKYVYDLTTKVTKNFSGANSLNLADTFHAAGVGEKSNVTRGVPRLHELLSNTKNPKQPMCNIFLDKKHRHDLEMATKIGNNIESTTIGNLLLSEAIYIDIDNNMNNVLPEDKEIMKIYKMFSEIGDQKLAIENNMWVIKLEFDRKKIIESRVSMSDIQVVLNNKYPSSVLVYMDDNANKLIFRIKLDFVSNPTNADDDIIYLKEKIEEIKTIMLKGVIGISKIYYNSIDNGIYYEKVGDVYEEKKEITLSTDGSNLFDILITDGVDSERTYSIDPNEMNSIFGIECARFIIEEQINSVLDGSDANTSPRHVSLLCSKMTRGGDIMSVDRHGINKENIGPLAKSSFEETTDQLLIASMFGDKDDITGVSANIMVGQIPPCGTGNSKLLLDEEMLETQETVEDEEEIDYNKYFESSAFCSENDEIKFNINAVPEEDIELDDIPEVQVS